MKSVRHRLSRVFSRVSLRRDGRTHTWAPQSKNPSSASPQPGRPLPELPPELWILILEYSTYPSSPTGDSPSADTYAPRPFPRAPRLLPLPPALTPASLAPRLAHYRHTMRHKRTLTLVSKQWHQYAQPVLYSSIWISRSAQAKALALTLLCQACCLSPRIWARHAHERRPIHTKATRRDARAGAVQPRRSAGDCGLCARVGAVADLLGALAQGGGLRALSWTNYDDPALVGLGVGLGMGVGLGVAHMGATLEYLELNFVSVGSPSPALRTLKLALDNATFAVLSTWEMPALRNLSVLSADFSYAGEGFRRFFGVHGRRLRQLELGHSSAHIEEHYLTAPPPPAPPVGVAAPAPGIQGAQSRRMHPDWIAPHLMLPSHPTVSLIGIRGIDARLRDDYARRTHSDLDPHPQMHNDEFFGLRAQMESLLRREAFPRLRYVRDLSEGSDAMRRGRVGLRPAGGGGEGAAVSPRAHGKSEARERERVVRFWEGVLARCRDEGEGEGYVEGEGGGGGLGLPFPYSPTFTAYGFSSPVTHPPVLITAFGVVVFDSSVRTFTWTLSSIDIGSSPNRRLYCHLPPVLTPNPPPTLTSHLFIFLGYMALSIFLFSSYGIIAITWHLSPLII
ncbi:hypothetical protein MVEN_01157700 [Mycena venus]|uniref:Uncharacterized protein n=1 Tax=Mycena venus TaxID=2733690 RepID=A0A8H7CXU8_9AGAR|nr:hypothetical protein MVEN_01157700 [Mycena venus]